ncbi:MFS transporter [Cellvibrio sp. NN19]|uniref:MFS transporter n=1 Tax=Cellvibrio chitinivorans TaxID=3102792 RepID=UPI002B40E4CC|nr:MFS transporter [Cellvibrio sp. NN19]
MQEISRKNQFFFLFIILSMCSGITIGMNKILITLLGLSLHLENWQMGLINGAESFAMALATLPAGLLLAAYSPRVIYAIASLLLVIIFLCIGQIKFWSFLPALMTIAGFCIAFRIVAMSSSFMQRLPEIGKQWAGWYKGSLSLGIMAVGPLLGQWFADNLTLNQAFFISASFFSVMAILGWFTLPSAQQKKSTSRSNGWFETLWQNQSLRQICIYEAFGSCIGAFFGAFLLVIVLREYQWQSSDGVLLLVSYGCVYVSLLLGGGNLLVNYSSERLYYISHAALVAGGLLLAFAASPELFFIGVICNGIGLGLNNLINMSRIANLNLNKSHASGILTMGQMLGGTSGAVLGGMLGDVIGLQNVFIVLILPWIFLLLTSKQNSSTDDSAESIH